MISFVKGKIRTHGDLAEAEDRLTSIYNVSKKDARLVVLIWRYIKTPGTIN